MSDVNLNSPDLKLVRTSDPSPARASTSPRAEGGNASAQSAAGNERPAFIAPSESTGRTQAQKLEDRNEDQRENLDDAVSRLNDFVQTVQRDLQFEVDNDLGKTIVRVVDQQTQETIRQIPDDVALRLAENLQQDEPLSLFNIKV